MTQVPRRICVFTGTRAEYGLLYWTLRGIEEHDGLELELIVSGTHLMPKFGMTVEAIKADGFRIGETVDLELTEDSPAATSKALGRGIMKFTDALTRLAPDVLVVLGDRYEALAVAQAAMMLRIPIAHIHGGERTEGQIDEAIRHSMTKMAQIHFPAAEAYRHRIIQMGEDPAQVFNVGAPVIENLKRLELLPREALESRIGIPLRSPVFSVTYHPVTLERRSPAEAASLLCAALDRFPDARVVLTGTNADMGNGAITEVFTAYADAHPDRAVFTPSLGLLGYLSLLRIADAVIGNSSSGIIEAPAVGVPTVNVGPRQRGRARAQSIIDCPEQTDAIEAAIHRALNPSFRETCRTQSIPYGDGDTSAKIVNLLSTVELDGLLFKSFHDLPFAETFMQAKAVN